MTDKLFLIYILCSIVLVFILFLYILCSIVLVFILFLRYLKARAEFRKAIIVFYHKIEELEELIKHD